VLCNGSIGLNQSTTGFRKLELASFASLVKMTKENKRKEKNKETIEQ